MSNNELSQVTMHKDLITAHVLKYTEKITVPSYNRRRSRSSNYELLR